jgi:hypothetical protein
MDMPPDVDPIVIEEGRPLYATPKLMKPIDSVDPEFIAWAEERGIELDSDDARELIKANIELPEPSATTLEEIMAVHVERAFASVWHMLNHSMYVARKEAGVPPVNPDSEDGFFSRADAQRNLDEILQKQRTTHVFMKEHFEALRAQREADDD